MKKYLIQVIKTFVPVMVLVMCFVIDASGNENQIDTLRFIDKWLLNNIY